MTEKDQKNMFKNWKDDFDQQTGCEAPVYQLKYTTDVVQNRSEIIIFADFP